MDPVNIFSVLVTTLLAVAVSSIWYSPLVFGKISARKSTHLTEQAEDASYPLRSIILSLCIHFLFFYALAYSLSFLSMYDIYFKEMALMFASVLVTYSVERSIRDGCSWSSLFVHVGYMLVILFGGLAVIGYWPW
jgi:hypothetical protein